MRGKAGGDTIAGSDPKQDRPSAVRENGLASGDISTSLFINFHRFYENCFIATPPRALRHPLVARRLPRPSSRVVADAQAERDPRCGLRRHCGNVPPGIRSTPEAPEPGHLRTRLLARR